MTVKGIGEALYLPHEHEFCRWLVDRGDTRSVETIHWLKVLFPGGALLPEGPRPPRRHVESSQEAKLW